MKSIAFSFFLLAISFTLSIAKQNDKASSAGGATFNIEEACKNTTAPEKCATILKSFGGDKGNIKPSKFSDQVVKHAQSEFGKVSNKARKEMREDKAKVEVKKALSHCVKLYLDMNDELRGLMAVGLKSSNYGTAADKFSSMAQNYPRLCEDGLKKAGASGKQFEMYSDYMELVELGDVVTAVTRYVSANSSSNEAGGEKKSSSEKKV